MGWTHQAAVRHLPAWGPRVRARGGRDLAQGVHLCVRVPRVRSVRLRRWMRRATDARAPLREVPARDRGDAEQLAGLGVAVPGRRGSDLRDVQDPELRAPE